MDLPRIHDLALGLDFCYALLWDVIVGETSLQLTTSTVVEPATLDIQLCSHGVKPFKGEGFTDQVSHAVANVTHERL